ncbi:MAG: sodium:alanine symporter family protein [Oscillospiraceae bacterium]|jgi:AGCS family alanine or glycine:cation symporter|nr:sodium:alanine symporter family protein [Oscillospiraceae bacterium]
MDRIVEIITSVNSAVNGVVWGIPMLILIISTGIYMTVRTGFFQITKIKHWANETFLAIFKKRSVTKTNEKKAISQFQALSTALAATIGTGNIAGVATAIAVGGPGAVFWMWLSAFFGMMTNYSENVLGIFYRKKNDHGEWSGGAMYYINEGLKDRKGFKHIAKPLAVLFSIFCVLASFGIGNMTQVNSISSAMKSNFNIPTVVTGIVLAVIAALVIVGGIKRIASVTEKLVPFMALFYIIGCLIIFFSNFHQIPYVFSSIFSNAFNFGAIAGGIGGYIIKRAVTMGFKRGVFSNEAGLGSSVMVHSASDVKEPVVQGMWGIFEVFFDTIIVCTLTSFVILSSPAESKTFNEAMQSISTEAQYFEIHTASGGDIVNLIDDNVNALYKVAPADAAEGTYTEYAAKTVYGQDLTVRLLNADTAGGESDFTYANVMEIRGVQGKNADGTFMTDENGNPVITSVEITEVNGVPLVTYAFSLRLGSFAGKVLAIAILLFAFSTVLGWSFYGTKALEYLFGTKATIVYKVIFVLFVIVGCTMNLSLAWDIADTLNGLMAVPNLIGVLLLSATVVRITGNYIRRKIKKTSPDEKPMLSVYTDIQAEQAAKLAEEE